MENTNFKAGDKVHWLLMGKVALRDLVIVRITPNQQSAWVRLAEFPHGDQMIFKLKNLQAA